MEKNKGKVPQRLWQNLCYSTLGKNVQNCNYRPWALLMLRHEGISASGLHCWANNPVLSPIHVIQVVSKRYSSRPWSIKVLIPQFRCQQRRALSHCSLSCSWRWQPQELRC